MSQAKKLQTSIEINAPVARVWELVIGEASYRDWTSAFAEGSHFKGSWDQGERIFFLAPNGDGIASEVAVNRLHEYISLRHFGMLVNGVIDSESESVRKWMPAFENYTFTPTENGTKLSIELDVTDDFEQYMRDTWPLALARLKAMCEEG